MKMKWVLAVLVLMSVSAQAQAQQVSLPQSLAQRIFAHLTTGGTRTEADALAAAMLEVEAAGKREAVVAAMRDRAERAEKDLAEARAPKP